MRRIDWAEAERLAGDRVDRRRSYAYDPDESGQPVPCDVSGAMVYSLITATGLCSGCACDCHPGCSHGAGGCEECGYSGRSRQSHWVPYLPSLDCELKRANRKRAAKKEHRHD